MSSESGARGILTTAKSIDLIGSMATTSELVSFLLASFKGEDAPRLALYHYVKNFVPGGQTVTVDLINRFLADCLLLPYWQAKKDILSEDILDVMTRFNAQFGEIQGWDRFWKVSELQILDVQNIQNLFLVIKRHEREAIHPGESLRLITMPDQILVVRKTTAGTISVRTYGKAVFVSEDRLVPVGPTQELIYEPNLELKNEMVQRLRPTPYGQISFAQHQGIIEVRFVSGFLFKLESQTKIRSPSQEAKLFYPLKNLEKFYVYRESDPYYVELFHTLKKALQVVEEGTPDAQNFARQAFSCGQNAFEHIYNDDKPLHLALRELAKRVNPLQKPAAPEILHIAPSQNH